MKTSKPNNFTELLVTCPRCLMRNDRAYHVIEKLEELILIERENNEAWKQAVRDLTPPQDIISIIKGFFK